MRRISRYLRKNYYKRIKKLTDMKIKINYYRKLGMKIDKQLLYILENIEWARSYLISIGNHVTIALNVFYKSWCSNQLIYW